jgi:hypothetical protein
MQAFMETRFDPDESALPYAFSGFSAMCTTS